MDKRSIATPAQTDLGIEAFIVEIPDAVGRIVEYQGWTKVPTMAAGQYVGFCFVSDGDEALSLLEARVITQATDIEQELAPPAPVTPAKKPAKAKKNTCPCPQCNGYYADGVYFCRAGREHLAYSQSVLIASGEYLDVKVALDNHRHEGLRRAA